MYLRGRKLLQILRFYSYSRRISSQNLGRGILWCSKSKQSAKVFSLESFCYIVNASFSVTNYLPMMATASASMCPLLILSSAAYRIKLQQCSTVEPRLTDTPQ